MMDIADLAALFDLEERQSEELRQTRAKIDKAIQQYVKATGRSFMRSESVKAELAPKTNEAPHV